MLPIFDKLIGYLSGKRIFCTFVSKQKMWQFKEKIGQFTIMGKKGNNLTGFMVFLSNKTMQNYPPKGERVSYPDSVVRENR